MSERYSLGRPAMPFVLESPAFVDGAAIPRKFARSGQNVSPPLAWKDAPPGTRSFVLIVEDPDAPSGTFRHWALYDIDPRRSSLPEGASMERVPRALSDRVESPGRQEIAPDSKAGVDSSGICSSGVNDFGHASYDGPQPPKGHGVHHYHFRLAALDTDRLDLSHGARVVDVWNAAAPHILTETELVGTFETR
jgi:Raf kinase inhibitor-like YbhB/YbcL family protein